MAAGFAITTGPTYVDFALARYNADGSLDASFGADGLVTTDFAGGADLGNAAAIQNDGKVIVAGAAFTSSRTGLDVAVARYAGASPHRLRFYLHGRDVPGTAGGFTMDQTPAPDQTVALNQPVRWFSEPALTGTFQPDATFTVTIEKTLGLNLALTVRLSATQPDGSGEQTLGQVTQLLGGFGPHKISIPVATPVALDNHRLKLTLSTAGVNVHLQTGSGTFLEVTTFVGTP